MFLSSLTEKKKRITARAVFSLAISRSQARISLS